MKNFKSNILVLLSFFCIVTFSLNSCSNEEKQQRILHSEKQRLKKEDSLALKVGILPTSDCDFLRLADTLQIFKKLGVDVRFKNYGSLSECRHAIVHKLVEGAVLDSVLASTIEKTDTTPLTLAYGTQLRWKLLTSKKSRVIRMGQLGDKIIAADSKGASHQLVENAIDSLRKKKEQIFIIQCEDINVRSRMLRSGNVDAAMLPEPFASIEKKHGAKELALNNDNTYGVIAFRSEIMKDERIKKNYELFLKGCNIAKDSLNIRQKANAKSKTTHKK